jgi:hypothetical protein
VAELTNGTSARERGLWWSSSGGHRHGADSLKTEAEGEKMGWGSGPAARAMRRETSGRGGSGDPHPVEAGGSWEAGEHAWGEGTGTWATAVWRLVGHWAGYFRPGPTHSDIFYLIQNVSTVLILIRSKASLPLLKNFQLKYTFKGFEERNNFPHGNIFRLEVDFE